MMKLVVATLAAMYLVALSAGQPEEQAVTRDADPQFELSLASFVGVAEASSAEVDSLSMTDGEAIEMALATGAGLREGRQTATPLLGTAAAVELAASASAADAAVGVDLWRVTGDSVNLRSGPGTGNDVVAQLSAGTEAEVLDQGNGWFHIRTPDGAVDGWIFGKFLSQNG